MALTSNSEFEFQLSTNNAPITALTTAAIDLHGRENGLRDVTYPVTATLREKPGYYSGTRNNQGTDRKSGTFSFTVDTNATTKPILGKEGRYAIAKETIKNGATTVVAVTIPVVIESIEPVEDEGVRGFTVSGRINGELTYA